MEASNGCARTPSSGFKLQLEAVQTVMPSKPTDPRQTIRVHLDLDENPSSGILKRCFNVVLFYNKSTSAEDSGVSCGSVVTGWIKESLGRALSDQPMLAGRLRPNQDGQGEFEIVSNDSGIRLMEADFAMPISQFLDSNEKEEMEAELVFWEDLDREQNPQFSPLFYVQVTNFSCGGYSIGISCSPLLIDPFAVISFLKKWTDIHIEMVSRTDAPKVPISYRPYFRNDGNPPILPFSSNTKQNAGQSVIFTIPRKILDLESDFHKKLAALCIEEAEQNLGQKTAPNYLKNVSFLVKEPSKDVKSRNFTRDGLIPIQKPSINVDGICSSATWNDLGVDEMCFQEGNKPAYVSCWINSIPNEGFVMINNPSPEEDDESGMKIAVTLPV